MEGISEEIFEIDESSLMLKIKSKNPYRMTKPLLLGTTKSDFRNYSTRTSHFYSSLYSLRRDFDYKKNKISKW